MSAPPPDEPADPKNIAPPRQASFGRVMAAVFWSFFGVRKKGAGERDMLTIKPLHVIVAGLLGAALLVIALLILVTFITRHA